MSKPFEAHRHSNKKRVTIWAKKFFIYANGLEYGRPWEDSFKTRSDGLPGPRPGFKVLIGSPGLDRITRSAESVFFSNQNDVVLVKKQKKIKVNGFATGSWSGFIGSTRRVSQVTLDFFFLVFSLTRSGSSPGSTRRTGRVSKLWSEAPNLLFSWAKTLFVLVLYQSIRCTLLLFYVIINF